MFAAADSSRMMWLRDLDDSGVGFAVVGDGERYTVRQSPSGLGVAYVQSWPLVLERAKTSGAEAARK